MAGSGGHFGWRWGVFVSGFSISRFRYGTKGILSLIFSREALLFSESTNTTITIIIIVAAVLGTVILIIVIVLLILWRRLVSLIPEFFISSSRIFFQGSLSAKL